MLGTNQSNSSVGRDQIGRDQNNTTNNHIVYERKSTQLSRLLGKLSQQIVDNDRTSEFVDNLKFYIDARDIYDVVGLKNKLEKVGRSSEFNSAIEKKEEFVKLLLKFENFSSAQEIFAYVLSIIHDVFESKIIPQCDLLQYIEIEEIVNRDIVGVIIGEIDEGSDHFTINRTHIRGMVYWLADKCFVRWHK